ncbi:unnamed protein product [Lymnaea stagnalis]|uniref:Uncharacterized protein n=1 Tax=Lymnaea stagnalis TaxID=6523 RepID=A0AAV2I2A7_LYMST
MNLCKLNQSLSEAVDLFIIRKFDLCFRLCTNVIKTAKCDTEQEGNQDVIEAATALGIQALAENDMWQHTVAFINNTYGAIELCPPRIIQVCILLHAHVKEYAQCHQIVQMWLKNPHNINNCQCSKVIQVYAHHILCPTGSYEMLQEIVQSCSNCLTLSEKSALLKLPQAGRFKDAKFKSESYNPLIEAEIGSEKIECSRLNASGLTCTSNSSDHPDKVFDDLLPNKRPKGFTTWRDIFKIVQQFLIKFVWTPRSFGLIVMGIFAFWGIIQTQTGGTFVTTYLFVHAVKAAVPQNCFTTQAYEFMLSNNERMIKTKELYFSVNKFIFKTIKTQGLIPISLFYDLGLHFYKGYTIRTEHKQ